MIDFVAYSAADMIGAMVCGGLVGAAAVMLACWCSLQNGGDS